MTLGTAANVQALATALLATDRIVVTIAPAGNIRRTISETFDGEGYRLDGMGDRLEKALNVAAQPAQQKAAEPQFPLEAYMQAIKDAGGKPSAKADGIRSLWEQDVAQFKGANKGTRNVSDAIVDAVLTWATTEHGIKTGPGATDKDLFVDPNKIVTRTPVRAYAEQAGTFVVQLQPVWG